MPITTETSISAINDLMNNYVLANHWAVTTLVGWLKTKPASALEQPVPSSFPGIRETLVHIWDTERFWLSVIRGEEAPPSFRMVGFHGTLDEVFEGIQATSHEFANFVTGLSDDELCEQVELNTPWVSGRRSRYDYIQHAVNHSSYHRGQVITMGHQLGFHDAPMTDFNFYLMVVKEQG